MDLETFAGLCRIHGNLLLLCKVVSGAAALALGAMLTAIKNQPASPEEVAAFLAISLPTSLEIARVLDMGRQKFFALHPNQIDINEYYRDNPTKHTWDICAENGLTPVFPELTVHEQQ